MRGTMGTALALAIAMTFGVCPASSYAEEPVEVGIEEQELLGDAAGSESVDTQGIADDYAVALVGSESFVGIDEAFDALAASTSANTTLVLLKDVQLGTTKSIGSSSREDKDNTTKIINLNGHTITKVGTSAALAVRSGTLRLTGGGTLNGRVEVLAYEYGEAPAQGGSKPTEPAVFQLEDATIHCEDGMGVIIDHALFVMLDGTIEGCAGRGVYNYQGTFKMQGGTICDNNDSGVKIQDGSFEMTGGTISGNTAATLGGGVFLQGAKGAKMTGGTISQNVAQASGGGVYVGPVSDFTMSGGTIADNVVALAGGHGGGVYVEVVDWNNREQEYITPGSSFSQAGGTISGNIAAEGGGVYVQGTIPDDYTGDPNAYVFRMTGGTVEGNVATTGNGGGVYLLEGNTQLRKGEIQNNEAQGLGGGIYVGGRLCLGESGGGQASVLVAGNIANSGAQGTKSNVYLPDGQTIEVAGIVGDDTAMGVTTQKTTPAALGVQEVAITSGYKAARGDVDPFRYFSSDNDWYYVDWNERSLPTSERSEAALKMHTHDWTYAGQKAENTARITATCTNVSAKGKQPASVACSVGADPVVTLAVQNKVYDGKAAQAQVSLSKAWTEQNGLVLPGDVTYCDASGTQVALAVEVGTYAARVAVTDERGTTYVAEATFVIEPAPEPVAKVNVSYTAHQQKYGNLKTVKNGKASGKAGKGKRLEAIRAKVSSGSISYRSHVQGIGWEKKWSKNGAWSGTKGQSKRIEAIQMRYSGEGYSVWYRVYSQGFGWLGWARDGEPAGTSGQSKRTESYEVLVLPSTEVPNGYNPKDPAYIAFSRGSARIQNTGWIKSVAAGRIGKAGKGSGKAVEAIDVRILSKGAIVN